MSTLTIKKIDETTISVSSDTKGVINELSDFFSFYAPGYKYDKRFQNHIWDGRIRLVNLRTETAPQGLTSNIIKFCNDRGYHFAYMANPEKCIGCGSCALVCPDACIEVYRVVEQ